MSRLARLLLVVLVGCGSTSLKKAGDTCTSTSECDKNLLCDVAQTPHVCAAKGSLDAALVPDAAISDARPQDGPADARPLDARPDAPPDAPPD
ncbi:MAG: hypothetical protein JWO36_3575 [Myxococcales bacterium]|nr:hypothetical protein [Myxococcales bacterium]